MRKRVAIALVFGLLLLGVGAASYGAGVGTSAFNFLKLGPGVRAAGMGGAFCAVADDASALYWNPAGLTTMEESQLQFQHTQYVEGITYEYLALTQQLDPHTALGASFCLLNSGNIERTTVSDPGGTGETFTAQDTVATFGTARKMNDNLALGVGVKFVTERLDDEHAQTWAFDLGALLNLTPQLTLGAGVQNLGDTIRFTEDKEEIPLNYRVGFAYQTTGRELLLALDLNKANDNEAFVSVGTEFNNGPLAFRGGYATGPNEAGSGFSFGLGADLGQVGLDYAWVPYGELGSTHRVAINFTY